MSRVSPELTWIAPVLCQSGYGAASRNFLRGLHRIEFPTQIREIPGKDTLKLRNSDLTWYLKMTQYQPAPYPVCTIFQPVFTIAGFDYLEHQKLINPGMGAYICSTMFESDRISPIWVESLEKFSQIWVPTEFNRQTFSRSGLDAKRIQVVPIPLDIDHFDRRRHYPEEIPGLREDDFKFLSAFEWIPRKGWEVLLKAYFQEFKASDPVSLTLKVHFRKERNADKTLTLQETIAAFAKRELGKSLESLPRVVLYQELVPEDKLPGLYLAHDAFVLPTRGEGWGMPMMEAMSMGLPTAATAWSAHTEFMNESNAYLIDVDGLVSVSQAQVQENNAYAGHLWAEPSVKSTREAMRRMFENRDEARGKGELASKQIREQLSFETVAKRVASVVRGLAGGEIERPSPGFGKRPIEARSARNIPPVKIAYKTNETSSAGQMRFDNELLKRITPEHGFQLVDNVKDADWLISHDGIMPPLPLPASCKWVWISAWPYSECLPKAWVQPLLDHASQIWVTSEQHRENYLRHGFCESKVRVLPIGVDRQVFTRQGDKLKLETEAKYRVLSLVSWDSRQGLEDLLDSHLEIMRATDDICFVVKMMPSSNPEQDEQKQEVVRKMYSMQASPELLIINEDLSDEKMAQLYRSCDLMIDPTRAGVHGMAAREAMASGTPVILPANAGLDSRLHRYAICYSTTPIDMIAPEIPETVGNRSENVQAFASLAALIRKLPPDTTLRAHLNECLDAFSKDAPSWEDSAAWIHEQLHTAQTESNSRTGRALIQLRPGIELSFARERFGIFGDLQIQFRRSKDQLIYLATDASELDPKLLQQLCNELLSKPELNGIVLDNATGMAGIFHPRGPWKFPLHEDFKTGAYLLEFLRLAEEQGLLIAFQEMPNHPFATNPDFERECKAVLGLQEAKRQQQTQQLEAAATLLEETLRLKPDYLEAIAARIEVALKRKDLSTGSQLAKALFEKAPNWSKSLQMLGEALIAQGQIETGGAWLYRAMQKDPLNEQILVRLAEMYRQIGKLDDARVCCARVLKKNPENETARKVAASLAGARS